MELTLKRSEIISSSEISKNFAACRDKVKENSRAIIFKNNQPDIAMLDINTYESLLGAKQMLEEILDDINILKMVEERDQNDNGKRYTLEQLKEETTF